MATRYNIDLTLASPVFHRSGLLGVLSLSLRTPGAFKISAKRCDFPMGAGGAISMTDTYLTLADLQALLDVSGSETIGKDLRAILGLAAGAQ